MKRLLLLAGCLLLLHGNALAAGIGPYLEGYAGGGELEFDNDPYTYDINVSGGGVGIAFDTAPGDESVFNYRLKFGYDSQDIEFDINDDAVIEMDGFLFDNIFGFAVVKTPRLRWWIGPEVLLGRYEGETDAFFDAGDWMKIEVEKVWEFGIGAATGINFKLGRVYLCPSAGIRWVGGSGETTITNYTAGTVIDDDIEFGMGQGYAGVALLF